MTDNTNASAPIGVGDTFAAKDIGGVKYPRNILTTSAGVDINPLAEGGSVTVTGSVAVTGPATDTQLRATPLPVSGTLTVNTGLTDTQLRATPVPVSLTSTTITGTVAVTQSGTWNIGSITTLPSLATGANVIGGVTQSGTWTVTGTGGTFPITAAALPLPSGAATDATLAQIATDNTASGTITTQNLVPTGTATAGSAVEISTIGKSGVLAQTVGTWTGTLQAQGTIDGTNWVALTGSFFVPGGGVPTATIPSASQNLYGINCAGMLKIRIAASAAMTGSVVVTLRSTLTAPIVAVGASLLGAGSSAIGDVGVQYRANATGAATLGKVLTAASTNATSLKGSAGRLLGYDLTNTTAAVKVVHFHNKASAPTVGTDSPTFSIVLPPNGSKEIQFPGGLAMATGIAYSITGAIADLDTTVTAVGDVIGVIAYA